MMKHRHVPSDEEYEVYSIALSKMRSVNEGECIIFRERTSSVRLAQLADEDLRTGVQIGGDPKKILGLQFSGVETETLDDFVRKNTLGGIIEPKFMVGA